MVRESHCPVRYVLLGATGDLARKKIMPALARLVAGGEDIEVVASSRRPWGTKEYQAFIRPALEEAHAPLAMLPSIRYVAADFSQPESLSALATEAKEGAAFHLAIEPNSYVAVIDALGIAGAFTHSATRLVIEKPFGHDEGSARELQEHLANHLPEERVYRIDHYLGKTGIRNVAAWRAGHRVEEIFAAGAVREIRIALTERQGIEGRGAFYDATGVLRDVVQNHALESFAAVVAADAGDPAGRLAVLRRLSLVGSIEEAVRQGQYAGFLDEPGVAPGSRTSTAIELTLNYQSETGPIPLTITAGKALAKDEQALRFVAADEATLSLAGGDAYERLIKEVLACDRRYFVSFEEVLAAWQIIDPVQKALSSLLLTSYKRGSVF